MAVIAGALPLLMALSSLGATFHSPDPKTPFSIETTAPTGDRYQVLTWTLVSPTASSTVSPKVPTGTVPPANGQEISSPSLDGVVRVAVFGGANAIDLEPPDIEIDGQTTPMLSRKDLNPSIALFPIGLFEFPIDSTQTSLEVVFEDGSRFKPPALQATPQKIAVLGDTGCRDSKKQSCTTEEQWPLYTIAEHVASQQPGLILHAGDFLYTEVEAGCSGKTCSADGSARSSAIPQDFWQAWLAEFFLPAMPLLAAAPLAVARGNHEGCDCTGKSTMGHGPGWFFLLQAGEAEQSSISCRTLQCGNSLPPVWFFEVGPTDLRHRFFQLDSATANDTQAQNVPAFQKLVEQITENANGFHSGTVLTHKPLWGAKGTKQSKTLNATLQAAFGPGGPPPSIKIVQAGHIHTHEVVRFDDGSHRALQMVTGNSGVELNAKVANKVNGEKVEIQGQEAEVTALSDFGYDLWTWDSESSALWRITALGLTFSNGQPVWSERQILP